MGVLEGIRGTARDRGFHRVSSCFSAAGVLEAAWTAQANETWYLSVSSCFSAAGVLEVFILVALILIGVIGFKLLQRSGGIGSTPTLMVTPTFTPSFKLLQRSGGIRRRYGITQLMDSNYVSSCFSAVGVLEGNRYFERCPKEEVGFKLLQRSGGIGSRPHRVLTVSLKVSSCFSAVGVLEAPERTFETALNAEVSSCFSAVGVLEVDNVPFPKPE